MNPDRDPPPLITTGVEQTRAAAQQAASDVVEPPSIDLLDFLAAQDRDPMHRADVGARPWYCNAACADDDLYHRGTAHGVVQNCLVDLPYPHCINCGTPNPSCYEWRMTEVSLYNVNLDVPVLDQGLESVCTQYACATAALLSTKLGSVRYPHAPLYTATPDVLKFTDRFYRSYYHLQDSGSSIPLTLSFIRDYGIPILNRNEEYQSPFKIQFVGNQFNLRIGGYWQVDHTDVPYLTRLLASGFPLVATINSGRRFHFVNGDEVYDGPEDCSEGITHSVAIIGSGLRLRLVEGQAVYETYFVIRDSHGPFAHGSSRRSFANLGEAVGYDMNVWASALREVWGFYEPRA